LLHLLRPSTIPIIDQHNFRAMNYYLSWLIMGCRAKSQPSTYEDLLLLADFGRRVRNRWKALDPKTMPATRALDQYLMMFWKDLKATARRGRAVGNISWGRPSVRAPR